MMKRFLLFATLCAASTCTSICARAGQVLPAQRLVWAHAMIVFPLDLDVVKPWLPEGYESAYPSYPLDARRNYPEGQRFAPDVRSAKAAGLNGFSVDIFQDGNAADGYLDAADQAGDFHIAACLDGVNETNAAAAIVKYCESASKHPSAAKVGAAFVIFTYGTGGSDQTPAMWQRVRAAVKARGYQIWLIPDLDKGGRSDDMLARAQEFFPVVDAGYTFGSALQRFPALADLYQRENKPFGGGMMPGYYRVGGGFYDARGTQTYRAEWHRHLAARPNWAHIATWNDLGETTQIMPDSEFNLTRSDITHWFANQFRGQELPWNLPRLYITTPKWIYDGQSGLAEGLVLNPLEHPLQVSLQLVDSQQRAVGASQTAIVAPHSDGAATMQVRFATIPKNRFYRARATLRDGQRVLSSVLSAPILLLEEAAQPNFAPIYYSIPALHALPGKVTIALDGTPTQGRTAHATIGIPPNTRVQFSDVIFNGEVLRNFLTQPPTPLEVPRHTGGTTTPDGARVVPAAAIKGGTEWGFYLARVIDEEYRVAYSDPIWVAPPQDVALKDRYHFDEGEGQIVRDASPFRHSGEGQNLVWIKPGFNNSPFAISFNGKDARLNLSLGSTPSGPLELKLAVRPRAYGGMFFCDSGGLWLTTTAEGHIQLVRLGPNGWATLTGNTSIPLKQWTQLTARWDGAKMQLWVNGALDGAVACPPKFASGRRALGYNPFGAGSGYYDGDLDEWRLRALPLLR